MGAAIFVSPYNSVAGVQMTSLPRYVSQSTHFQSRVVSYFRHVVEGGTSIYAHPTAAQKIWDLRFFVVVLITVVTHPQTADLGPSHWELCCPYRRLCVCLFLLIIFLLSLYP